MIAPDERRLFHYWTTDDGQAMLTILRRELRVDEGIAVRPAPRTPVDPYMSLYVGGQHAVLKLIERWTRESVSPPVPAQAVAATEEPLHG